MAFKKGHTVNKSKGTDVSETVKPIMDTPTEEEMAKADLVKSVIEAQNNPPVLPKVQGENPVSEHPIEFSDEPRPYVSPKTRTSVRLQAIVKKYRDRPFMCCAPYSNAKRKYLTGQEDLTPEELAKQPIIIDPNNQYPIVHGMVLYPDKADDKIMLNFFKNIEEIAFSKSSIKAGVSLFYIENREEEAEEEIKFSRRIFMAMEMVNKCSLSRMQDVVLLLDLPGTNLTKLQAENLLWKECQKNPERVISQFGEGKSDELFIRKLLQAQILFHRIGEGIYERIGEGQNMFLGKTVMEAVKFVREANNANYVVRWSNKLKEKGLR